MLGIRYCDVMFRSFVLILLLAGGAAAQTAPMHCDSEPLRQHATLMHGDQNAVRHLDLNRSIPPSGEIDLDVCFADLTVSGGKDDKLHVSVVFENPEVNHMAIDYLQGLEVSEQGVRLQLHLPASVRARVAVVVPSSTAKLKVDLVRGGISFRTHQIRGDREINLSSGHVMVLGNADSYASMQVAVGFGSFHDRRTGASAHGVISRALAGTGSGSIAVNVARGSAEVKAWD
jgi:hypothetical protein